ncbi:hypothetical protein HDV00_006223 [Rhizophlyctis rosea]|nr:hypothetical protein HDV00_006223 [Rhizophlyctis rosea]
MTHFQPTPQPSNHDPSALFDQAQNALVANQPSLAKKFLLRVLEQEPSHLHALEALGVAEVEAANLEAEEADSGQEEIISSAAQRAYQCFLKAVEIAPNEGSEKYLHLGQMSEGVEAIGFYTKGVEIGLKEVEALKEYPEEAEILRLKISSALCSMSEIYMTDMCDDPQAEHHAESFATRATQISPQNPEAYQTLASVRMSQCQPSEARTILKSSLPLWNSLDPASPYYPSYNTRLSLSKILLELDEYEDALFVIETCQLENDLDPEGWYLEGFAYWRMGGGGVLEDGGEGVREVTTEEEREGRSAVWGEARECFEKVLEIQQRFGTVDDDMVEQCTQFLGVIRSWAQVGGGAGMEEEEEDSGNVSATSFSWADEMDAMDEMEMED